MAKYDPLHAYLRRQRAPELELTFRDIENLIGYMLPGSAEEPEWWADQPTNPRRAVQRRAWRDAGYDATLLVGLDRVKFSRA